jgi:ribosomal protein S18 acetylase RimI-like enzyme
MAAFTIKTASAADEEHIVDVITIAFATDPLVRWIWRDPHQYLVHMPALIRAAGGKAIASGSAYYADRYAGVALWLPPGVHVEKEDLRSFVRNDIAKERRVELIAVFKQMSSYHPQEPHWYLPLIGVDPINRGHGCGSALMRHALLPCDRGHELAYLESSNPRNLSLYIRHGFEIVGTIQVGSSPPLFPMVRKPR